MRKSTDKAHIQQSLAEKLWKKVKACFHMPFEHTTAIPQNLSLLEEELELAQHPSAQIQQPQSKQPAQNSSEDFEVELTLDELQNALYLLEQQNKDLENADNTLKQLIEVLKKSEKTPEDKLLKDVLNTKEDSGIEVIVEFIPLNMNTPPVQSNFQPKTIYREIRQDDLNDKLKKEKEQRELAKKITHYPPSDRLH